MELIFKLPNFNYNIDSIMQFQTEELSEWWSESFFAFYPQIDKEYFKSLEIPQQKNYLYYILQTIYKKEKQTLKHKLITYNQHWKTYKIQIEQALSDAFQYDCKNGFNNIVGNITLNPICPRYINTHSFDVFYLNGDSGALGTAMHEIIHFIWFEIWQQHFNDNTDEYETPHIKWVFSEMVVDPIIRKDNRLRDINPYFGSGCVYDYFYTMNIKNKPILETLYDIYINSNIIEFMEKGYSFCLEHESEIRSQMK